MNILIFSDGHGNIKNLEAINDEINKADLILFGGDFTRFNRSESGQPYLDKILNFAKPCFSVLGNCDYPEMLELTKKEKISIDGIVKEYEGLYFAGSGGGSKFTGTTPNERTDEELYSDFHQVVKKLERGEIESNALITISHNPPFNTKLDRVPGANVGSKLIRNFIEKYEPLLHISGHIHESLAIDKLGKSVLINPGSLAEGRYASCEIVKNSQGFEVKNLLLKSLDSY